MNGSPEASIAQFRPARSLAADPSPDQPKAESVFTFHIALIFMIVSAFITAAIDL